MHDHCPSQRRRKSNKAAGQSLDSRRQGSHVVRLEAVPAARETPSDRGPAPGSMQCRCAAAPLRPEARAAHPCPTRSDTAAGCGPIPGPRVHSSPGEADAAVGGAGRLQVCRGKAAMPNGCGMGASSDPGAAFLVVQSQC